MKKRTLLVLAALLMCVLVLFAACKKDAKTVTLTFDAQGGPAVEAATVEIGKEHTLPEPEREGYRFEGWYATADLAGEKVEKVVASADATYYAKWKQLYAVNLELGGGTLSAGKIYLDEGAVVYDFVKDLKPTKAGYEFGAWYVGDSELAKNLRMTTQGVTLTAKYKTAYKIELYTQKLEGAEYEKVLSDLTYYAYEGSKITMDTQILPDEMKNYTVVTNPGSVHEITLGGDAAANVLKCYFDRKTYTVNFMPNYPGSDSNDGRETMTVRYGSSVTVPSDLEYAGYCLIGWSTSKDAKEATYRANYVDQHLYNTAAGTEPAGSFTPERNTTLYAVWATGYTDMFGGSDAIFLFAEDATDIYMLRGDYFFKGSYNKTNKTFIFDISAKEMIEGKLVTDTNYTYYSADRKNYSGKLFVSGTGLVESTTIYFDEYNGITYAVKGEDGKLSESFGTYIINEEGYYEAVFPETHDKKIDIGVYEPQPNGTMAGKSIVMILGTVRTGTSTTVDAFQIRQEADVELGRMYLMNVQNGGVYYSAVGDQKAEVILNGFGTAVVGNSTSASGYYYSLVEENGKKLLTLQNSQGRTQGIYCITELGGETLCIPYNKTLDQTFTNQNGEKLTLDGMYNVTYTDANGQELSGIYSTSSSVFGSLIIDLYREQGKVEKRFLLSSTTTTDENNEAVTVYDFSAKLSTYAEYYYKDANGIYYCPLVVIDENTAGVMSVYGYDSNGKFVLKLTGAYQYDKETKLYTFAVADRLEGDSLTSHLKVDTSAVTAPVAGTVYYTFDPKVGYAVAEVTEWAEGVDYYVALDYTQLKQFTFATDNESTSYTVYYWYSYENNDGTGVGSYSVVYTSGNKKLTFVAGVAIYEADGTSLKGTYVTQNGLTEISFSTGTMFVELNEADRTFLQYQTAPYNAYVLFPDLTYNQNIYVSFDGKGGMTYIIVTPAETEGEEDTVVKYVGSFTELADKAPISGDVVYHFSGTNGTETKEFDYIMRVSQSMNGYIYYVCPVNTDVPAGEYFSATAGKLELDGFNYTAKYTDADGKIYDCIYYFISDSHIYVVDRKDQTNAFHMDIVDATAKTFTRRGAEYANYIAVDNQASVGFYYGLDGYGKLEVFNYKLDADGNVETDADGNPVKVVIDANGSYTVENGVYTLKYTNNGTQVTVVGKPDVLISGQYAYNIFVTAHEEAVRTYINKADWSLLVLDNIGNATKYNKLGQLENGTYTMITPAEGTDFGLLYYVRYVNNQATDACIYKYWANGEAEQLKYSEVGYYTKDLQSLVFSKYGIAVFNAETNYYYYIEADGNVKIYRYDDTAAGKNVYGYVEQDFGTLDAQKAYDADHDGTAETYFKNNSARITFARGEVKEQGKQYPFSVNLNATTKLYFDNLQFTPTGEAQFRVVGTLIGTYFDENNAAQTQSLDCIVVREVNEGVAEMYILIPTGTGYFRYDITVDYCGEDLGTGGELENNNKFTVTSKQLIIEAESYSYLYISSMLGSFGIPVENTFGTVVIVANYDADDNELDRKMTITFGEGTVLLDYNGEKLDFNGEHEFTSGSFYTVTLTGNDGYTYHLNLRVANDRTYGTCYQIYSLGRVETLTTADGNYQVEIERVVYTETSLAAGTILNVKLSVKDGEDYKQLDAANVALINGKLYYVVRTVDEATKRITSTKYYLISTTEEPQPDSEGEEETEVKVMRYTSVSIETLDATTIYNAAGLSYMDVKTGTDDVLLLSVYGDSGNTTHWVASYDYDTAAKTYVLKTYGNVIYKVTMETGENGETLMNIGLPTNKTTYFTEDGKSYVNIGSKDQVILLCIDGVDYYADSTTYNEMTKTYTVTVGEDTYTVQLVTKNKTTYAVISVG